MEEVFTIMCRFVQICINIFKILKMLPGFCNIQKVLVEN